MEIKATLNKPYTESQRLNFVVEQSHRNGYEIKETDLALEAWGYTESEQAELVKRAQILGLIAQLDAIDLKTIRSLRAIQSEHGTQSDADKLGELELQAENIRQQIRELQGEQNAA